METASRLCLPLRHVDSSDVSKTDHGYHCDWPSSQINQQNNARMVALCQPPAARPAAADSIQGRAPDPDSCPTGPSPDAVRRSRPPTPRSGATPLPKEPRLRGPWSAGHCGSPAPPRRQRPPGVTGAGPGGRLLARARGPSWLAAEMARARAVRDPLALVDDRQLSADSLAGRARQIRLLA